MIAVLICSAILIFTPILLVQYQRLSRTYSEYTPNSNPIQTPCRNRLSSSCTARTFLLRKRSSSDSLPTNSSTFCTSSGCYSRDRSSRQTTFQNHRQARESDGHMYDGAESGSSSIWRDIESSQRDARSSVETKGDSDGEDTCKQEKRDGGGNRVESGTDGRGSKTLYERRIKDGSRQSDPGTINGWSDRNIGNYGEHIDNRRESRKPWQPPFPTRARMVGDTMYRVLPNIGSISDRDSGDKKPSAEEGRGTRSTSGIPLEQEAEDALALIGHLPVTEPLSYGQPVRPPPAVSTSPPWIGHSTKDVSSHDGKDERDHVSTPSSTATTRNRSGRSISVVQATALVLFFIIFIFVFAILVAHCLAWLVVYKTEVRLGELRKGLLRGGDMRVCLCAR